MTGAMRTNRKTKGVFPVVRTVRSSDGVVKGYGAGKGGFVEGKANADPPEEVYTMSEDEIAARAVSRPNEKTVVATGSVLIPDEYMDYYDFQASLIKQKNGKWVAAGEFEMAEF